MIKERYEEALSKKENDINSFVWKGKKVIKDGEVFQEEKKLKDCTPEELLTFYNHCETMLYNKDKENPGRYVLLDIIKEQRNKCNAELFVRWLEKDKDTPRFVFMSALREFLNNNPSVDPKTNSIAMAVGDCPKEFSTLTISTVLAACLDTLGKFSKQHITLTFLLKQGIYLTESDLQRIDKNTSKVDYIRGYLDLKPNINVLINYKGLTLDQMRAMIILHSKKYSELSTMQLEVLRNRILFSLESDVQYHISQWEERERQIRLVLKSKGVNV
jgi:hypothetical protein